MSMRAFVIVAALLVVSCSRVTQENFAKVQDGMSEEAVRAILGTPTESNSVSVLGVSGTVSRWVSRDAVITVRFVNGKAALRSFDKPAAEAGK
ncbi:MAG: outer membrane protein assembly factor BamE domain-containing protein [Betaproteobacteria bacterium]